jgi:hypothetical protein
MRTSASCESARWNCFSGARMWMRRVTRLCRRAACCCC